MAHQEVDFVTCINCETPSYMFELDGTGKISSALCSACGNDDPTEFVVPEAGEKPGTGQE